MSGSLQRQRDKILGAALTMRRFFIINTPEIPSQWTHIFHCRKFAKGFEQNGFAVFEVRNLAQLHEHQPSINDFTYISSYGVLPQQSENLASGLAAIQEIAKYDCVHILWCFHDLIRSNSLPPFKRWILTGEKFYRKPTIPWHVQAWEMQNIFENYIPLTFASSVDPSEIGKVLRPERHVASFAGSAYKTGWCEKLKQIRNVEIRYAPPFFDDETRTRIFCDSVTCLGFHNDSNISNSVITERVFEGLALGNVVVSDNPACVEATDGLVTFISSFDELLSEVDHWWNDVDKRKERQQLGMKWAVSHGTYKNVANQFIEKSSKLWGHR